MSKRNPRPEVQALLRECKEQSWDDTPRMILADWMEEHGETEAEMDESAQMQRLVARFPHLDYP
jgi:uncharacterized protein (TIGR02996 family)